MRATPLLVSVMLGWASQAWGQSANEELGPRTVGVGESLRAAASGSLATTLNPAGVALARSYVIEGGYFYRPSDHANVQVVSLCDSATVKVAACLYYDHLSIAPDPGSPGSERTMHEGGMTTAFPLGDSIILGVTQRYVSYTDTDNPANSKSGYGLDVGAIVRLMPTLNAALVGYNLIGNDAGQFAIAIGGGLAFNVTPKLLLAADVRYDLEHSAGRYGGGFEYFVASSDAQSGFPIRLGYVYDAAGDASYLTAGLGFITPRLAVDAGMRKQVSNGDELMMQFSVRLFMPN